MATGDVIDFLEREGYDLDFIKTANRYLSYDSEHLILQCKNDIIEFGEKELVKMYLDNDIFYSYTLSRFNSKVGLAYFECTLKDAFSIFTLQNI